MTDFTPIMQSELTEMPQADRQRLDQLYYDCYIMLGGSSILVHLEQEDYDIAWGLAVRAYRSYSERSIVQQYGFLKLEPLRQKYVLDKRVDVVQEIYRRKSFLGQSGSQFDPFVGAFFNNIMGGGAAGTQGLLDYTLMLTYQNDMMKVFARFIHFFYRNDTNELVITQIPKANEMIIMKMSMLKSMGELLRDNWARVWLQQYTLAQLKIILANKLEVFTSLPGAQGGVQMNGAQLRQEGVADTERLVQETTFWGDSSTPPLPTRG